MNSLQVCSPAFSTLPQPQPWFGRKAYPSRGSQRRIRPLRIPGREEDRSRGTVLPLLDRLHGRLHLLRKQPQAGDPHRPSTAQRRPIWRRRSSTDESNCGPALRSSNFLFRQSFPNPAGHSYRLRRSADRARCESSFAIKLPPTGAPQATVQPQPATSRPHTLHHIQRPRFRSLKMPVATPLR
jgi:hypothetical protein